MNELSENWFMLQTDADQFSSPDDLSEKLGWLSAVVPGTVAQSLQQAKLWDVESRQNFDESDFWYKTTFSNESSGPARLDFSGLATIAEVWLNGKQILCSDNMFMSYQIDVSESIKQQNDLVLCFRSLNKSLAQRRPRPRWKTKVVEQQQLRWFRTTLLGRIPGWTPPIAPVGPWKSISLFNGPEPVNVQLESLFNSDSGKVEFTCELHGIHTKECEASLTVGDVSASLTINKDENSCGIEGKLSIDNPELWWPHTHGQPKLYDVALVIRIDGNEQTYELNPIGFKKIELDTSNDKYAISINGKPIFCRGACWTINDIVSLTGDGDALERTLTLMRDAGANMIRIGGTMVYEQDALYQLCDQLGILVWQDFMFANMDYPFDDEDFISSVTAEVTQQVNRLRKHVCLTVYCGNSEIEQQTAMLGMEKGLWSNDFFAKKLPELCKLYHPDALYVPSTPSGGTLPFHTNKGVTHYYGVGAYLRPVSEVRSHDVKFTSESLGFANIPVARTRNAVLDGQLPVTHHPKWKERTPRDTGPGWDFEDVRDHYLNELFNVDPVKLRSFDPERYIALSELVTGEMMSQVFSEWRSQYSKCSGGLVWFLKDFWAGAGWGVIDSNNLPKACYYYLKRAWQPISVCITDESLNGFHLHVVNDSDVTFSGRLEFFLFNTNGVVTGEASTDIAVNSGSRLTVESDDLLKGFYDTTYSYRFGPANHAFVSVQLKNEGGDVISSAYYFPVSEVPHVSSSVNLTAIMSPLGGDMYQLELSSDSFLYAVNVDVSGFTASDNFFHMLANTTKTVALQRHDPKTSRIKGYLSALNMAEDVKVKVLSDR